MTHLNIAQWNVRGLLAPQYLSRQQKCDQILRYMNKHRIDIMLLQEWSVRRNINTNEKFPIEFFYGYDVHYTGTETAILYRESLYTTKVPTPKNYNKADRSHNFNISGILITLQNSKSIGVYSTYRAHKADTTQIFQYNFRGDYTIIGGDFNLQHSLWGATTETKGVNEFINTLSQTKWKCLNEISPSFTYKHTTNNRISYIDLVFISNNINYNKFIIDNSNYNAKISDHVPIRYSFEFQKNFGFINHRTAWNIHSKKWNKYTIKLNEQIKNTEFKISPHKHVQQLTEIILNTAITTIKYKTYYEGHKPWWQPHLSFIIKKVKKLCRKLYKYKNKDPLYYTNSPKYNKLLKQWKIANKCKIDQIKKAKLLYNNTINQQIQNGTIRGRKFWNLLSDKNTSSKNHIPPLKYKNKIILNPNNQSKLLHDILTNPPKPPYKHKHKSFHKQINEYVNNYKINNYNQLPQNDILNKKIEYYEIRNCISEIDPNKAYGPDKIHNLMIINGGKSFWKHLVYLFNKCLKLGIYPQGWNYANITTIPKPGKDHSNAANYRPIAVSSCLGRIFEKVLAKRLQLYCIKNQVFNNLQCGFQINRNTEDILTDFITDAYNTIDINSEMDCIFTDFSKAYDSVWQNGLLYKLINLGINNNYLNIIKQFLNTRYDRVTIKESKSKWKRRIIGLPQGSSLSPILYILFTRDFNIKYTKFNKMGCFADDTAFWQRPANYSSHRKMILQRELNRFNDWCNYWCLSLNTSKCKQISITRRMNIRQNFQYKINNNKIIKENNIRYLGIYFDNKLNFKYHIDLIRNKVNKKIYKIKYLQYNGLKLSTKSFTNIYKTIYRPQIEYGLIYYYPYDINNNLQKLQNKFLHLFIPSKRSCPIDILQIALNIEPIKNRYQFLILRHWARAIHCSKYHPLSKTYRSYNNYRYSVKNDNKNKKFNKHPLYMANEINDKYKPSITSTIKQYNKNKTIIRKPITATPKYKNTIPTNYNVNMKTNNLNESKINELTKEKIITIYTDGSCNPNPGRGASAIYIPQSKLINEQSNKYKYQYPITITTAEITAISMALNIIKSINSKSSQKLNFLIQTDSKITLQYLQFDSYPKYESTKRKLDEIFSKLNEINHKNPQCQITIGKCKAHSNDKYNNIVDKIAKNATKNVKYTKIENISYQVTMTQNYQFYKSQWKKDWMNRISNNSLIQSHKHQIHKHLNKLTFMLNKDQMGIIIRLITGHIELNAYYFKYKMKINKNDDKPIQSPNCNDCKCPETVSHYLLKCKKYKKQRNKMFLKINKICNEYRNGANVNIHNLIFPFIIRCNIKQTLQIWKEILSYIRASEKWKSIYGIDINNI